MRHPQVVVVVAVAAALVVEAVAGGDLLVLRLEHAVALALHFQVVLGQSINKIDAEDHAVVLGLQLPMVNNPQTLKHDPASPTPTPPRAQTLWLAHCPVNEVK